MISENNKNNQVSNINFKINLTLTFQQTWDQFVGISSILRYLEYEQFINPLQLHIK